MAFLQYLILLWHDALVNLVIIDLRSNDIFKKKSFFVIRIHYVISFVVHVSHNGFDFISQPKFYLLNVEHIMTLRQTGKREFIHRRRSVGRNKPSPETTGECIRSRDCMDTVEIQMVYVEMDDQERRDGAINKERTRTHRCMHRHIPSVWWIERNTKSLSVSSTGYASHFLFSPNGASLSSLRPSH